MMAVCCTAVKELGSEFGVSRLELEMSRLEEVSGIRLEEVSGDRLGPTGPAIEESGLVEAGFDLALGRHVHFCRMGLYTRLGL